MAKYNLNLKCGHSKPSSRCEGCKFPYADRVKAETKASGVPEKVTDGPTIKRVAQMLASK